MLPGHGMIDHRSHGGRRENSGTVPVYTLRSLLHRNGVQAAGMFIAPLP